MKVPKEQEYEEGELPDEEPTPSDSAPHGKAVQEFPRQMTVQGTMMEQEESSGEIIFQTVVQKDYNYSPEKKKKKIHKQEPKPKPKEKEKTEQPTKDKDRRIQKGKSPTPNLPQEELSPPPQQQQREYQQQPPMPQSFYNPYMFMQPVNNMMPPHMYPPQYPLPYVHPPPYHYPGPMGPIPQGAPINHPHYPIPPQMYPNYPPKQMMPIKPQSQGAKFQPYKPYQSDYMKNQMVYPQNVQQKFPPMKMEQPNSHPMHGPTPYHINNPQQNNKNVAPANLPPSINQPPGPSPRNIPPDRIKQKERPQLQQIRQKKYDFKGQIKREVREVLKDLSVEQQQQLLEAIRCILKYHHLSHTLFPSQSAMKNNASLICYQKNLAKLEGLMSSQDSQRGKMIEQLLTSLQMKEPLMKLKQRILYHKVLTEDEHQLGQQLRVKIAEKGL